MSRPALPRKLEREVLVEAGHRCAIPTCRQTPVEIVHIDPFSRVRDHTLDNLITLCPTCHTRYDNHQIDRQSMLQYKANLFTINSRYGDIEKRVLMFFADRPNEDEIRLSLSGNNNIFVMNLLYDGLLEFIRELNCDSVTGVDPDKIYRLTARGREFLNRWLSAERLE